MHTYMHTYMNHNNYNLYIAYASHTFPVGRARKGLRWDCCGRPLLASELHPNGVKIW